MNTKALATVIVGGLAVVLTIASAAGLGWIVFEVGSVHSQTGLFRSCVTGTYGLVGQKTTICVAFSGITYHNLPVSWKTCQALIIIAILVGIVGCTASVYLMLEGGKKRPIIAYTSYGVAALSCLICGAVFATESASGSFYGWSFYLCWVSTVLHIVAHVLSLYF